MVSLQTQYRLADLFKAIAEGEKQVEIIRQVLAEKSAFEPYAAFKRIDRSSNGYITTYELIDYLRENSVAALEKELITIFREHDAHREDRLSYSEFLNIVLPKTSSVLRQLATQRQTYVVEKDEVLPYEVEFALARIFEKEIELNARIQIHRNELAERFDFDVISLFRTIDEERLGAINFDSITDFFRNNDIPISEAEILALLRRVDKDTDGKVSYSEFHDAIVGKSSSYRPTSPSRISSPTRKIASPLRNSVISSPSRRISSPTRKVASPLRSSIISSPTRRVASPTRKVASPLRSTIVSSPTRKVASPYRSRSNTRLSTSNFFTNSANKLTNYDYIDYLHASAQRSTRSRSPTRSNKFTRSVAFETSTQALSPVRDSLTKRIQENQKELGVSDLNASIGGSVYRTPTKRVASPYRSRSPLKESFHKTTSPSRIIHKETLSPMKGNEEQQLADALKEQIELDKELEAAKVDLALRRDFNLLDTFKFFDIDGAGRIGKKDLKDGLNELGIYPTNDELYLVLRKYDTDNDGLLRFSDFSDILAPKEGGYAEILNKREPTYIDGIALQDLFSEQTIYLLKKTLNIVIRNEVNSESTRQRLNRRPLFNLWEAFKALDKDQNGFISSFEFKQMLIDHGFFPSHKEVSNLVERYDKNGDGKVSYSEFIQEITPKSPQRY